MNNQNSLTITEKHGELIDVARGVGCQQVLIVNVIFIGESAAKWILVDAGMYGTAARIRRAAEERYGANARPQAIVLTHGHFDHVGALRELADEWDVPIYAHALEMPYLTDRSAYPPPDPTVGGGAMATLSFMYPRQPIDVSARVRPLPADGSVPGADGWRWIHTPGHTAGHISLYREQDRTLIVGDAFVTTKQESLFAVLTQTPGVFRPPAYYTPDWLAAGDSVRRLAALEPEAVVTGHGLPLHGAEMRAQLHTLATNFERVAVPAHGRYVDQPAITDETGIVRLPPPVADNSTKIAVGVGVAALAGVGLWLALRNTNGQSSQPIRRRTRIRRRR